MKGLRFESLNLMARFVRALVSLVRTWNLEKSFMKKESLICFRVSKDLHQSLIQVAKKDQRSLSSAIEFALVRYLEGRKMSDGVGKEKRQYPRETLSIPALIYKQEREQMDVATITDISLSGVKILIPKDFNNKMVADSECARFEIAFTLPAVNMPIKLTCESKRVVDSPDSIQIGASFVDANFQSYRALQTYLM